MTTLDPQTNVCPFAFEQQLIDSTWLHSRKIFRQLLNTDTTITVDHIILAIVIQQQTRVMVKPRYHRTLPYSVFNILRAVDIEPVHIIG